MMSEQKIKNIITLVCSILFIAFIIVAYGGFRSSCKRIQKEQEIKNNKIEIGDIVIGSDGSEWESVIIDGCSYLKKDSIVRAPHGIEYHIPFFIHRVNCSNHE